MSESFVDARGLRCPWPVLRLARAMREANAVRIAADDPQTSAEIAALAAAQGWSFRQEEDAIFFVTQAPMLGKS